VAVAGALAQLIRAGAQAGVVQGLELRLQLVDGGRHRRVALDFPLVRVEELGQIQHGGLVLGYPDQFGRKLPYGITGSMIAIEPSARRNAIWMPPENSSRKMWKAWPSDSSSAMACSIDSGSSFIRIRSGSALRGGVAFSSSGIRSGETSRCR